MVNSLSESRVSVNSPAVVSASVLFSVIGGGAFLILPLVIGAAAVDFGLSDSQLGYLAASVMISLLFFIPACRNQVR